MINVFTRRGRQLLRSNVWNIGFVEDSLNDILRSKCLNIKWMKGGPTDRWFADPFILSVSDKEIVLLVEEFCYKIQKGRIAQLTVRCSDYTLCNYTIVLELPTHLSFPFIHRQDGKIYIMPENGNSGSTRIYEYDGNKLYERNVVAPLPLADAVILEMSNKNGFLISTELPDCNGSTLSVYPFDSMSMTICAEPIRKILFNGKIARNAGATFTIDGHQYRPAQDCNKGYGNGIVIQKINGGDETIENMEDVCRFYSNNPQYNLGYHTFNTYKGLTVVDGHRYRFPHIVKCLDLLRSIKNLGR